MIEKIIYINVSLNFVFIKNGLIKSSDNFNNSQDNNTEKDEEASNKEIYEDN